MLTRFTAACMMLALMLSVAGVQAADEIYLDPNNAGPDYKTQGEYVGKIGDEKMGAQVVALGDGKFDLYLLTGGLPGAGWTRKDAREKFTGTNEFKLKNGTAKIADGKIEVKDQDDKVIGTLERTVRKSPTLGAKPPKGAKVLFDGTSTAAFKNGKMTEDKLLNASVETVDKFGDFTLHVEFRPPFKPKARGQGRGNSGVYIQNRYECQVLDSFGLDGKDNECGGIYQVSEPIVNMCLPPLQWQTYDIDFTAAKYDGDKKVKNARVTIKHNGVVIHDDLELPKQTPGKHKEGPSKDGLYLQGHGNPVVYQNIWIVEK